ncbi:hypothetical protein [Dyella ginsengisoli]|uniref:hypothetical protein n=1 Tax=Dyella ginsengisoli TaxID=363848 RepID=UPI0003488CED|nr:hypothetical protein [Dyella ginsengisoli]
MRLLTQLIALNRARQLNRQLRDIQQAIQGLSRQNRMRLGTLALREIGQATRCDFPHLYGTPPEERYLPWGQGTEIGYTRARSENVEVAIRGIALWLAVAYHETKDAQLGGLQTVYRQLMRQLRELKDMRQASNGDIPGGWMKEAAAA